MGLIMSLRHDFGAGKWRRILGVVVARYALGDDSDSVGPGADWAMRPHCGLNLLRPCHAVVQEMPPFGVTVH